MPTEQFSRAEFESALAELNPDFISLGIVRGEYCYVLPMTKVPAVGVYVRSSVNQYGYAASTGEDSIRLYMVERERCPDEDYHEDRRNATRPCPVCRGTGYTWEPRFSSKPSAYTTRVPGWQGRLWDKIGTLAALQEKAGTCPQCREPKRIFLSHSAANPNRWFAKCTLCNNGFQWL